MRVDSRKNVRGPISTIAAIAMRILIADEDTGRAARLERVLRSTGHDVETTRSSAELRERIATGVPQACVIDALFSGGPETIAELGETVSQSPRSRPRLGAMRIVVFPRRGGPQSVRRPLGRAG